MNHHSQHKDYVSYFWYFAGDIFPIMYIDN